MLHVEDQDDDVEDQKEFAMALSRGGEHTGQENVRDTGPCGIGLNIPSFPHLVAQQYWDVRFELCRLTMTKENALTLTSICKRVLDRQYNHAQARGLAAITLALASPPPPPPFNQRARTWFLDG